MGELHLEIIVDRMKREFGVEANVGKPQVAYRETIRKTVRRQSKASSCASRAARASTATWCSRSSRNEPARASSSSTRSRAAWFRASTSRRWKRACVEALNTGVLAGYPVVDVKVTLHFGSYHDVDSNEKAFKMAAIFGFKEGCRKASPVILEPMMAVEVETPEDYAGNVMGDLSSRRGMVQGMDDMPSAAARSSRPKCRCRKCSATRPRCVRCRKAAPRTRWNSSTTPKLRATWPKRSSLHARSNIEAAARCDGANPCCDRPLLPVRGISNMCRR